MDGNNWRSAAPGGEAPVDQVDWRTQLGADSRLRIVDRIMESLKRHLPFSGPEGLQEIKKIAVRFEEKIYTDASSQTDYLRKISLKMLTLENRSLNTIQNTAPVNPASNSNRLPDTGVSHSLPSPVQNPSQAHQQLVSQNMQNSTAPGGVQISTGLTTSLPSVSGITQSPMINVVGLDGTMQNVRTISQAFAGNEMGQTEHSRVFSGSQRHMENVVIPQQHIQAQNYLYFALVQNQPQTHQQFVSQNVQNNITPGVQSLTGLNTFLPSVSGIKGPMTEVDGRNSNMQNMRSISQASASLDPVAQSGQVNAGDWQEEAYQKIKQMRENYMPELTEMYQKVTAKLQQHDSMPQQLRSDQHDKLKMFKQMVDSLLRVLQTPKSNITPGFKEKLVIYEKQIQSLSSNRPRKPIQQELAQSKEPLPSPLEPTLGCPICLGPLVKETTTRCGHIFCENCINAALAKQSRCPTCRMLVVAGDLIRVFLCTNTSVGQFWGVP